MRFIISGATPSKKNNKQIVRNKKTGQPFIISSTRHNEWEKNALEELKEQYKNYKNEKVDYPVSILAIFYNKDKIRKDLDNQITTVLDALVKAKILKGDDVRYVAELHVEYGGVDKDNPRAEVEFY